MRQYPVTEAYLNPNEYSRPQRKLQGRRGVVIHYVGNTLSTGIANRNYWNNLPAENAATILTNKQRKAQGLDPLPLRYASAHEVVGLHGEVILALPEEMGYHVGSESYTQHALDKLGSYPNATTYGIEATHINDSGEMSPETYESLAQRAAKKLTEWGLDPHQDLWLHKEVVGWKNCHLWFVNNPNEWAKFKDVVASIMNNTYEEEIDVSKAQELEQQIADLKEAVAKLQNKPVDQQQTATYAQAGQTFMKDNGLSDGTRPEDPVTRQEVWTMIYNAVKYLIKLFGR